MQKTFSDVLTDEEQLASSLISSWIKSVEEFDREGLANVVSGWAEIHTKLLISELEKQIERTSLLSSNLYNFSTEKILHSIRVLSEEGRPHSLRSVVAGFSLLT